MTKADPSPRLLIPVVVGREDTLAVVDTGGVYFICTPPFARLIGLDPSQQLGAAGPVLWRGALMQGGLHFVRLTFPAIEGNSIAIGVTAFVPRLSRGQEWNDELPCVLGMQFCLERLRFAVDPEHDMFYFGELGEAS